MGAPRPEPARPRLPALSRHAPALAAAAVLMLTLIAGALPPG